MGVATSMTGLETRSVDRKGRIGLRKYVLCHGPEPREDLVEDGRLGVGDGVEG